MISLREFLRYLLPHEGFKCFVAIAKGQAPRQILTPHFEELEYYITAADTRNADAYFACASYASAANRKQENALSAKGFWLDIDAGPGKPYSDAEAAMEAVDIFAENIGLPFPTVVYSGNGIHAWWVLDQPLPRQTWIPAAQVLKRLVAAHSLHADPSRTADIASILRPVGTHNRKDPANPKWVRCDQLQPLIDAGSMLRLLSGYGAAPSTKPAVSGSIMEAALNRPSTTPRYAALAANHCGQLRAMRDTRGNLPEPLWYANLCVLAFSEDGDALAHEWSNGHANYSHAETEQKLAHAKASPGPATCQRFKDLNPDGCKGCPHNITSPILLGEQNIVSPPAVTEFAARPKLPFGFKWGQNMQLLTENKDDERPKTVSEFGIFFDGECEAEATGKSSYVFRQWIPHKGWTDFAINARDYEGPSRNGIFAENGANVQDWRLFDIYVKRARDMIRAERRGSMRFEQFGWKGDDEAFLVGDTLVKNDGTVEKVQVANNLISRARMMQPAGSLEGWSAAAEKLYAEGFEAQGFCLTAGFAATLMRFACGVPGAYEGGAILSLMTEESGRGKSTALKAIASAWGELDAIRLSQSDTVNAKFSKMGDYSNTPIIWDEMRHYDPHVLEASVLNFTEGKEKDRSGRDGAVTHKPSAWQTILITASNKSLLEVLRRSNDEGPQARVFEIDISLPAETGTFSKDLEYGLMANRGFAARAFLHYLIAYPGNLAWTREAVKKMSNYYGQLLEAGPEHRYIVWLLACSCVASMLLNKSNILQHNTKRIIDWGVTRARAQMSSKPESVPAHTLSYLINENMLSCLVVEDRYHPKKATMVRRANVHPLRMRYEIAPARLYIDARFANRWLSEQKISFLSLARQLENEGVLRSRGRVIKLGAGVDLASGSTACWEIDMSHPAMSNQVQLIEEREEETLKAAK